MTIIEQLWYEKANSDEIIKTPSPRYSELLSIVRENELKLLSLLTDEEKELFHKYADTLTDLYEIDNCDIFTTGFRTGARLMLEIIENNKKGE